jgi:hypothetical protein
LSLYGYDDISWPWRLCLSVFIPKKLQIWFFVGQAKSIVGDFWKVLFILSLVQSTLYSFFWAPCSEYLSCWLDFIGDLGWGKYVVPLWPKDKLDYTFCVRASFQFQVPCFANIIWSWKLYFPCSPPQSSNSQKGTLSPTLDIQVNKVLVVQGVHIPRTWRIMEPRESEDIHRKLQRHEEHLQNNDITMRTLSYFIHNLEVQ